MRDSRPGSHRRFALGGDGAAVRYRPDVRAFAALHPAPTDATWRALAAIAAGACTPAGIEISAICADPTHHGQGLGG